MMMVPTVHLNGTSREALLEQYTKAHNALEVGLNALCAAAPNGRDYYPQGPDAFAKAQAEHSALVTQVAKAVVAMLDIAEALV